ncbi:hypothetical protein HK100_006777 [Physocladia obscura]|uniref:RRM domain-containing protein n=1 Tax=Physocladia obscura TaxID=109957 RepID=A0AAD5T7T7_9FUNG|nr:hypothetical protein HK100_006777 [Physocladia obscura]
MEFTTEHQQLIAQIPSVFARLTALENLVHTLTDRFAQFTTNEQLKRKSHQQSDETESIKPDPDALRNESLPSPIFASTAIYSADVSAAFDDIIKLESFVPNSPSDPIETESIANPSNSKPDPRKLKLPRITSSTSKISKSRSQTDFEFEATIKPDIIVDNNHNFTQDMIEFDTEMIEPDVKIELFEFPNIPEISVTEPKIKPDPLLSATASRNFENTEIKDNTHNITAENTNFIQIDQPAHVHFGNIPPKVTYNELAALITKTGLEDALHIRLDMNECGQFLGRAHVIINKNAARLLIDELNGSILDGVYVLTVAEGSGPLFDESIPTNEKTRDADTDYSCNEDDDDYKIDNDSDYSIYEDENLESRQNLDYNNQHSEFNPSHHYFEEFSSYSQEPISFFRVHQQAVSKSDAVEYEKNQQQQQCNRSFVPAYQRVSMRDFPFPFNPLEIPRQVSIQQIAPSRPPAAKSKFIRISNLPSTIKNIKQALTLVRLHCGMGSHALGKLMGSQAVVEMKNLEVAGEAIHKMNGFIVDGSKLKVVEEIEAGNTSKYQSRGSGSRRYRY